MYRIILVPIDESEYARHAVYHAVDLADEHGASLHVLGVVDRRVCNEPGLSSDELVTIGAEDRYNERMSDARERAASAGVDIDCAVRHGIPYEVILEYADAIDADLILLGAHGEHHSHVGGIGRRVIEGTDRDVRVVDAPVRHAQ